MVPRDWPAKVMLVGFRVRAGAVPVPLNFRLHAQEWIYLLSDSGAKALFAEAGVEFPDSGPVSWAPLFASFGDDALRFQLIFDLCEDLRVDFRIQQLVPNYLHRLVKAAGQGARHAGG